MNKHYEFECPHCHKVISMEDFSKNNHNALVFNEIIVDLRNEQRNILKEELKLELYKQFNREKQLEIEKLENQINSLIEKHESEKINLDLQIKDKYKNQINQLENKILNIEENNKATLDNELLRNKISYQEQVSELTRQINDLKHQEKLNVSEKEKEKIELINQIHKEYEQRIVDLQVANAQNKIMHSKRKGENFEHEVELDLRKYCNDLDIIEKQNISIDSQKADYIQTVRDNETNILGKIIYEVKNAEWKDSWIEKLVKDVRNNNSKYGILVATSFNERYYGIPFIRSEQYHNIWLTDSESFVFVGQVIRKLIEVEYQQEKLRKQYVETNNNELLLQLEHQKSEMEKFWMNDFPMIYKNLKKSFTNLDKVSLNLNKQSDIIDKTKRDIEKELNKNIISKLSTIFGQLPETKEVETNE